MTLGFCPENLGGVSSRWGWLGEAGAVADQELIWGVLSLRQMPVGERLGWS